MRKIGISVFVLVALAIPMTLLAQIPNPGFETWTGTGVAMQPTGWTDVYYGYAALGFNPILPSTTAHSGTYSVQGSVVKYSYLGYDLGNLPPWLFSSFSFTQRPAQLTGWYQLHSVNFDSLEISTFLYSQSKGAYYAGGTWGTNVSTTGWTKFTIPLDYGNTATPDTGWIQVTMSGRDSLNVGTFYLLDDLAFEGTATAVAQQGSQIPTSYALRQNYPNPFNPSTTITYELPKASMVRLSVFDLLGQEVATVVNEQKNAGVYRVRFDGSALPSGMYFYRLDAGSFVATRRFVLVK